MEAIAGKAHPVPGRLAKLVAVMLLCAIMLVTATPDAQAWSWSDAGRACVTGGTGGAVGGAITGSLGGGIGAAPGAAIGAAGGCGGGAAGYAAGQAWDYFL